MFIIGLEGIVTTLPLLSVRVDLPGTDLHAVAGYFRRRRSLVELACIAFIRLLRFVAESIIGNYPHAPTRPFRVISR